MINQKSLEDHILTCWTITDEIGVVYQSVMDDPDMSKDEIANILLGLQELYSRKFDQLFRKYEELIRQEKLKPYGNARIIPDPYEDMI